MYLLIYYYLILLTDRWI